MVSRVLSGLSARIRVVLNAPDSADVFSGLRPHGFALCSFGSCGRNLPSRHQFSCLGRFRGRDHSAAVAWQIPTRCFPLTVSRTPSTGKSPLHVLINHLDTFE